jgi:hypothetical protein
MDNFFQLAVLDTCDNCLNHCVRLQDVAAVYFDDVEATLPQFKRKPVTHTYAAAAVFGVLVLVLVLALFLIDLR